MPNKLIHLGILIFNSNKILSKDLLSLNISLHSFLNIILAVAISFFFL